MILVTDARALPNYRVRIKFSDGTEADVALEEFVFADARPVVRALRDPAAFAALRVDNDTVVWSNGFDLAPEFLWVRRRACTDA